MGLRFRRSIKIAPGVRWNLGLKGSSFSFGPRGAKLTLGNRGTRVTTGIPGTGLSYTTTLPSGSGQAIQAAHLIQTPEIPWDETLIDRMGVDRTQDVAKRRLGTISVLVFFAGVGGCLAQQVGVGSVVALGGLIGLMVAGAKPTAAQLAIRERDHRIQVLRETTGQDGSRASLDAWAAKREELQLLPAEFPQLDRVIMASICLSLSVERFEWQQEAERKRLAAHDEMEAYRQRVEANGGRLEPVDGHEGVVGGTPCYFAGSAVYDKRGPNDESGMLYLTERGFLFVGESRIDVPWSKVVSVEREGDTTLLIQRRDRQTPTMFVLDSLAETLRAEFIAATLR